MAEPISSIKKTQENKVGRKRTAEVDKELSVADAASKKARLDLETCEAVLTVGENGKCTIEVLEDSSSQEVGDASCPATTSNTLQGKGTGECNQDTTEKSEIFEAIITVNEKGKCFFEMLDNASSPENSTSNKTDLVCQDGREGTAGNIPATGCGVQSTSQVCDKTNVSTKDSKTATNNKQVSSLSSKQKSSPYVKLEETAVNKTKPSTSATPVKTPTDVTKAGSSTQKQNFVPKAKVEAPVKIPKKSDYVALDCEFVGVKKKTEEGVKLDISALGRCSIVDFDGKVLCDVYAKPKDPICTYRTKWSGIKKRHMQFAVPASQALAQISAIIKDKIVVGHAVKNDFDVLEIDHPVERRRDTSLYRPFLQQFGALNSTSVSLKTLASNILDKTIQKGSHCSVVDAQTTMEVFKSVREEWETSIANGQETILQQGDSKNKKKTSKKKAGLSGPGPWFPGFPGNPTNFGPQSDKHPVSALGEFCAQTGWANPVYEVVHDSGPPHMKTFICKVSVNQNYFQPSVASSTKKEAKVQAATVALQQMGLVPNTGL